RLVAGGRRHLARDLARRLDQGANLFRADTQLWHGSSILRRRTERVARVIRNAWCGDWRRRSVPGDLAGDDQALDVAGALVNLADPHVAVDALDREIGEIAVAAMDLDRVRGNALGHLRAEQFRHRRLGEARLAGIALRSRVEHEAAGRGDLRRHVREAKGDGLMRDDLLAESLALLGIGKRRLVCG